MIHHLPADHDAGHSKHLFVEAMIYPQSVTSWSQRTLQEFLMNVCTHRINNPRSSSQSKDFYGETYNCEYPTSDGSINYVDLWSM